MIRSIVCAALACAASVPAAFAGPYVNVEANSGFVGSDYSGTITDLHVGFDGALGDKAGYYIQGGPAVVAIDGEDQETELSGKVGLTAQASDKLGVYGEISVLTNGDDDANYGTKVGVKYSF